MKNLLLALSIGLTIVACTKEPVETCNDVRNAIDAKYAPLFQEALGANGVLDFDEVEAVNALAVAKEQELAAVGC